MACESEGKSLLNHFVAALAWKAYFFYRKHIKLQIYTHNARKEFLKSQHKFEQRMLDKKKNFMKIEGWKTFFFARAVSRFSFRISERCNFVCRVMAVCDLQTFFHFMSIYQKKNFFTSTWNEFLVVRFLLNVSVFVVSSGRRCDIRKFVKLIF